MFVNTPVVISDIKPYGNARQVDNYTVSYLSAAVKNVLKEVEVIEQIWDDLTTDQKTLLLGDMLTTEANTLESIKRLLKR